MEPARKLSHVRGQSLSIWSAIWLDLLDFFLLRLIIKCVWYSPEFVSFNTFRNLVLGGSYSMAFCECPWPVVFHQLEKSTREITEQFRNVAKQAPTNPPKSIKNHFKKNFNKGVNINYFSVSNEEVNLRTYERGVEDETLSCGTGAVALAVCLEINSKINNDKVLIYTKGGELKVSLKKIESTYSDIWLSGGVEQVYSGESVSYTHLTLPTILLV